jgi:hypothetical protein
MGKFFILIAILFHLSKGSQVWKFTGIESILEYPYHEFSFSDLVEIRSFLTSLIQIQEFPEEFRGRIRTIIYFCHDKEFYEYYFKIKKESKTLKKSLDLAEEYFKIFFKEKPYHQVIDSLLEKELAKIVPEQSHDLAGGDTPDDVEAARNIKVNLAFLKERIRPIGSTKSKKWDEYNLVQKIFDDINSCDSICEQYIRYISKVRLNATFSNIELEETGSYEVLYKQFIKRLFAFKEGTFEEETAILAAHRVLVNNYYPIFSLLDCIRSNWVDATLSIFDPKPTDKDQFVREYRQYRKLYNFFSSIEAPKEISRSNKHHPCIRLMDACIGNNSSDFLLNSFHEICSKICPNYIDEVKSPHPVL